MLPSFFNTIANPPPNPAPGIPNTDKLISVIEECQPRISTVINHALRGPNPLVAVFSGGIESGESYLSTLLEEIEAAGISKIYSGTYPTTYRSDDRSYVATGPGKHLPVIIWRLGSLYLLKALKSWSSDDFSYAADYFEWHSTIGEKEGCPGFSVSGTPVFANSRAGRAMAHLSLALLQLCRIQTKYKTDPINKEIVYYTYYYMIYAESMAKLADSVELCAIMQHARTWHAVYTAVDYFVTSEANERVALRHISAIIATSGCPDIAVIKELYVRMSQVSNSAPGLLSRLWADQTVIPSKTFANPPGRVVIKTPNKK